MIDRLSILSFLSKCSENDHEDHGVCLNYWSIDRLISNRLTKYRFCHFFVRLCRNIAHGGFWWCWSRISWSFVRNCSINYRFCYFCSIGPNVSIQVFAAMCTRSWQWELVSILATQEFTLSLAEAVGNTSYPHTNITTVLNREYYSRMTQDYSAVWNLEWMHITTYVFLSITLFLYFEDLVFFEVPQIGYELNLLSQCLNLFQSA